MKPKIVHSDQIFVLIVGFYCFVVFLDWVTLGEPSQSGAFQQHSNLRRCEKLLHHTALYIQPILQCHQVSVQHTKYIL